MAFDWLPMALLTPIRNDFGVSVACMGEALGWFGSCAVLGAQGACALRRRFPLSRSLQAVLLLLAADFVCAGVSTGIDGFIVSRIIGGVSFGAFWTLSTGAALLLAAKNRARALGNLYVGNAVTTACVLPLAVFACAAIGWRGIFAFGAVCALAAGVMLGRAKSLDALGMAAQDRPVSRRGSLSFRARHPDLREMGAGFAVLGFMFVGAACVYPYLRVFLERASFLTPAQISWAFALEGVAGIAGVTCLKRRLSTSDMRGSVIFHIGLLSILACTAAYLSLSDMRAGWACWAILAAWGWGLNGLAFLWPAWLGRFAHIDPFALVAFKIGFVQVAVMAGTWIGAWALDMRWGLNFGAGAALLGLGFGLALVPAFRVGTRKK